MVVTKYDFKGQLLHGDAEIKIPNWLTFELLLFFTDLSAGLTGSAPAVRGEEKRGG